MSDTPAAPGSERSTSIASIASIIQRVPARTSSASAGGEASSGEQPGPSRTPVRAGLADRARPPTPDEREASSRDTTPQRQSWLDAALAGHIRRGADMVHLGPGLVIPGTRYRLLRWLGDGGMGVVYEAEHIDIDRRVAVKILRLEVCDQPQALQLFRDEARAAGRIGSPHIVEILDFAELPDGRLLYTMELLGGRPLARELGERPLAPARVIAVLRQVCKGLASAHAAHIVHRDIKPDNIFLGDRQSRPDVVKILDFGISIFMVGATVTDANILGTPLYLAPEVITGRPFDARVDMYAVGCTAFEMLTGRPPYEGTVKELLFSHVHAPLPSIPALCRDHDVPRELAEVVMRCLAKDPADRYADMDDLEAALCEAQIAAKLETTWDDLALPNVEGERRDRLLRGMPDPAMMNLAQARPRKRWYFLAALVGSLLLGGVVYAVQSRSAAVAAPDDPQLVRLEAEARAAAARVAFVYPPADDPQARTSYHAIRELEELHGPNTRAARELARSLRREFAGTLGAFGDRLWERPGGLEFAVDAYAQALLFDPDLEPAASRADLTPGQLARLAGKAATLGFSATELIAVEPLVVLAESDIVADTPALRAVRDRIARRTRNRDGALVATAGARPPAESTAPVEVAAAPVEVAVAPVEVAAAPVAEASEAGSEAGSEASAVRREPTRDPAAAVKLLEQARVAVRGGQLAEAERLFEKTLAHDARSVDALAGLSELHFNRGAYARALSFGERACKLSPDDAALRLLVGDAAFKVFRYDDARAAYERARELGNPEAERRLAKLAAKLAD